MIKYITTIILSLLIVSCGGDGGNTQSPSNGNGWGPDPIAPFTSQHGDLNDLLNEPVVSDCAVDWPSIAPYLGQTLDATGTFGGSNIGSLEIGLDCIIHVVNIRDTGCSFYINPETVMPQNTLNSIGVITAQSANGLKIYDPTMECSQFQFIGDGELNTRSFNFRNTTGLGFTAADITDNIMYFY